MDKSEIKKAADHTYGESIARVVWAAHILSYLTGEQSHAETLQSETGDEDEDDSDGSESDAETDKWSDLTSADKHIRSKFLDCVAELLSPENGWDHVVAVGLLECEDFIEIDVARNDGFHAVKSQQGGSTRAEGAGLQYIEHLREYLSSILDQGVNLYELFCCACLILRLQISVNSLRCLRAGLNLLPSDSIVRGSITGYA